MQLYVPSPVPLFPCAVVWSLVLPSPLQSCTRLSPRAFLGGHPPPPPACSTIVCRALPYGLDSSSHSYCALSNLSNFPCSFCIWVREVKGFAQSFWTMARGLEYDDDDAALKEAFNICQNDPPPQWEMEQMRIMEFLGFSNYFYSCKYWQIHHQSPPTVITPPSLIESRLPLRRERRMRVARAAASAIETSVLVPASESAPVTPESTKCFEAVKLKEVARKLSPLAPVPVSVKPALVHSIQ